MSVKRIVGSTILAVLVIIGTYMYFYMLDFLDNLGFNLMQAGILDVETWQYSVWLMSILLATIVVFHGASKGHRNLEPIAALAFLTFTIVSYFIGCTIVTLGFPFTGFATLNVQITIDPTKLMGIVGGGGGGSGGPSIPAITISISLIQMLIVSMSTVYAVLQFVRTTLKSRRDDDSYSLSSKKSKSGKSGKSEKSKNPVDISYKPMSAKKDEGSMDFMKTVRKD
jgi:hypothetical protein